MVLLLLWRDGKCVSDDALLQIKLFEPFSQFYKYIFYMQIGLPGSKQTYPISQRHTHTQAEATEISSSQPGSPFTYFPVLIFVHNNHNGRFCRYHRGKNDGRKHRNGTDDDKEQRMHSNLHKKKRRKRTKKHRPEVEKKNIEQSPEKKHSGSEKIFSINQKLGNSMVKNEMALKFVLCLRVCLLPVCVHLCA